MALVNAFILPHSPLLIPEIGRANYDFLAKTIEAYHYVGEILQKSSLDTLIIISPHGLNQKDSLTINVAPDMAINFKDFGFILSKTLLHGDSLLADKVKEATRPDIKLQLISEPELDYGSAIPAYLLKDLVGDFKIMVISPAEEVSLEEHFNFGTKLGEIISASEKNIALIISGDLSHRLKRKSPGGYSPKGAKFDNKLIEYLAEPQSAALNILKMDANLIKDAGECGLKPIVIGLGTLGQRIKETKVLAYQTDFGIGYLSLEFKI